MKEKIVKEIMNKKNSYNNPHILIEIINSNAVDYLLNNVTEDKTIPNTTCIQHTKKGYLTPSEQFISLFENLVCRFINDFYFLKRNSSYILECILKKNIHSKYLLCKKYIGNNKFIPYFNKNYYNTITLNFKKNVLLLSTKSDIIESFLKNENIVNANQLQLYNILKIITLCNVGEYNIDCLFYDIKKMIKEKGKKKIHSDSIYDFYIIMIESFIKNYYMKKDAAKIIFNRF